MDIARPGVPPHWLSGNGLELFVVQTMGSPISGLPASEMIRNEHVQRLVLGFRVQKDCLVSKPLAVASSSSGGNATCKVHTTEQKYI